jgi:hypothetical protein
MAELQQPEEVAVSTAHSSPAGSFSNRRQKNLQKFRRHIASQRQHAHAGDPKAPESEQVEPKATATTTPETENVNPKATALESTVTKNEEPQQHQQEPAEEEGKPPPPTTILKVQTPAASPQTGESNNATPPHPGSRQESPVSGRSPQIMRRRSDIIKKKFAKKKHSAHLIESLSSDKDDAANCDPEDNLAPAVMSDSTNCKLESNEQEVTPSVMAVDHNAPKKPDPADDTTNSNDLGMGGREEEDVENKKDIEASSKGPAEALFPDEGFSPIENDPAAGGEASSRGPKDVSFPDEGIAPIENENDPVAGPEDASFPDEGIAPIENDPAAGGDLMETPSRSFDLRSIHNFPPEPPKGQVASEVSKDPSWDTAKVFFSEYQAPSDKKKEGDSMDMFDTTESFSWTATETTTFSRAFQTDIVGEEINETDTNLAGTGLGVGTINNSYSDEGEEKKEKDFPAIEIHTAPETITGQTETAPDSPTSDESPRRRSSRTEVDKTWGLGFGYTFPNKALDTDASTSDKVDHDEDAKSEPSARDDEDLLGDKAAIDAVDSDETWKNGPTMSKEERLQQYTADANNDSSVDSEVQDEESSKFSEEEKVVYMSHSEDEKESVVEELTDLVEGSEQTPIQIADDTPSFSLSAEAAAKAENAKKANDAPLQQAELEKVETPKFDATVACTSDSNSPDEDPKSAEALSEEVSEIVALQGDSVVVNAPKLALSRADGYISTSNSSEEESQCVKKDLRERLEERADATSPVEGSMDVTTASEPLITEENAGENVEPESFDLEESTSLVGISLVPSFGATSRSKSRPPNSHGIPPRGMSSGPPPPPPPPPLSKRKKKKKRSGTDAKHIPLIAPPPAEKIKKWEKSKNRPFQHLAAVQEGPEDRLESFREVLSEGEPWGGAVPAEQLACVGFADAFSISGLTVSPTRCSDGNAFQAALSPVETARSIALGNAMKRANGASSLLGDLAPSACGNLETSSSYESNDVGASASLGSASSIPEKGSKNRERSQAGKIDTSNVEEPPCEMRKDPTIIEGTIPEQKCGHLMSNVPLKQAPPAFSTCIHCPAEKAEAYIEKLIAPSMSQSPSHTTTPIRGTAPASASPSASQIIHDRKMAEKVVLASYAAAITFEEKYSASHSNTGSETTSISAGELDKTDSDEGSDRKALPSLFCAPELQDNLQTIAKGQEAGNQMPQLFFSPELQRKFENDIAGMVDEKTAEFLNGIVGSPLSRGGSKDTHDGGVADLKGGAFSPWKNAVYAKHEDKTDHSTLGFCSSASTCSSADQLKKPAIENLTQLGKACKWLAVDVLELETEPFLLRKSDDLLREEITRLLEDDRMLNKLCQFTADKVNVKIDSENEERAKRNAQLSPRKKMRPFCLGAVSGQKSSSVVAANFVSFMHRVAKASEIPSPFGEDNPFLLDLVSTSIQCGSPSGNGNSNATMQKIVFRHCSADNLVIFTCQVCGGFAAAENDDKLFDGRVDAEVEEQSSFDLIEACRAANPSPTKKSRNNFFADDTESLPSPIGDRKWVVSDLHPSPFEKALESDPAILIPILSCLGDPVVVCRMKMVNRGCRNFIARNEHLLMRDAVRLGGLSMNVRPSFWLWVTLEKSGRELSPNEGMAMARTPRQTNKPRGFEEDTSNELSILERAGREGKWHNVIQRDVARAFGNMPPHKSGARLRTDSIVRALVTWGRNRIMKRGVKGDGNPPSSSSQASVGNESTDSEASQTPTDTVSDWGGVSPVASFTGSYTGGGDGEDKNGSKNDDSRSRNSRKSQDSQSVATDLLVLSGNALTEETKVDLQNKLGFILHALAAAHEEVGYCQGMDYVVAHLLRILQDTVRWRAARCTLPSSILSAPKQIDMNDIDADSLSQNVEEIDNTLVVEETVFRVMDTLFTTYNLQHIYWPELRCLKTCCRVFERLIQLKLPVLADHFEHHELNVGLFALGWFQTLFLYLPSMPSATVCHMWDIWLVERSFKIFFRVGTAILFLSQPILLNHELEGMMTYLNTFPDATLLNPDILIACALQIKVTNKMLMEIESSLTN